MKIWPKTDLVLRPNESSAENSVMTVDLERMLLNGTLSQVAFEIMLEAMQTSASFDEIVLDKELDEDEINKVRTEIYKTVQLLAGDEIGDPAQSALIQAVDAAAAEVSPDEERLVAAALERENYFKDLSPSELKQKLKDSGFPIMKLSVALGHGETGLSGAFRKKETSRSENPRTRCQVFIYRGRTARYFLKMSMVLSRTF